MTRARTPPPPPPPPPPPRRRRRRVVDASVWGDARAEEGRVALGGVGRSRRFGIGARRLRTASGGGSAEAARARARVRVRVRARREPREVFVFGSGPGAGHAQPRHAQGGARAHARVEGRRARGHAVGAPERSGRGERAKLEETETELETEEGDETGGANETGGAPFRPRAVDAFVARSDARREDERGPDATEDGRFGRRVARAARAGAARAVAFEEGAFGSPRGKRRLFLGRRKRKRIARPVRRVRGVRAALERVHVREGASRSRRGAELGRGARPGGVRPGGGGARDAAFRARGVVRAARARGNQKAAGDAEEGGRGGGRRPRSRTPFGGTTTGKSGAHVRFALAPERVTVAAEVWNAAAEANARATSAELIAAKEARDALEKRRRLRRRDGSNPADEGGDDKTVTTKLSPPTTKKKPPLRPLDALAAAIAAGRIVAPPEPSRALAERRVVGGAWARADKTVQDSNGSTAAGTRDHPFSAVKDAYDSASDPFASWSRSVGAASRRRRLVR